MAFRCNVCNQAQPAGESPTMLVVEQRRVTYPERRKGKKIIDRGGNGIETVKEVMACSACATTNQES